MSALLELNLGIKPEKVGKVRYVYGAGDNMIIVATDKISAFDHVMAEGIPGKGTILTSMSAFWFRALGNIIPNHMISTNVSDFPAEWQQFRSLLEGRSMLVKRAKPLTVECIVRGWLEGSGLKEYRNTGEICGIKLPCGLVQASRLPEPIFTPSTKAETGHDENITFAQMEELCGKNLSARVRDASLALYKKGAEYAEKRGIIIADSKFEFGVSTDGNLMLIDEVLTPDSSRFWPMLGYKEGQAQRSYDKQFVRDYLEQIGWDKESTPPNLPNHVISATKDKYFEAYGYLVVDVMKD